MIVPTLKKINTSEQIGVLIKLVVHYKLSFEDISLIVLMQSLFSSSNLTK